jgi:hypothetical protein
MSHLPIHDDVFTCEECGMELVCSKTCGCDDGEWVILLCCKQQMTLTPAPAG